ncbi:hypothetical protein HJG60_008381 [Phyllostomus discolor]|uniref:Uncharacterized protein n=1 Tax=Phyllostomus discolor TaxID=89673 RepID=A0A833Z1G2_9CHIR|nr:hypothetical protein HJG60_008381 [Phyllostomus discolor]
MHDHDYHNVTHLCRSLDVEKTDLTSVTKDIPFGRRLARARDAICSDGKETKLSLEDAIFIMRTWKLPIAGNPCEPDPTATSPRQPQDAMWCHGTSIMNRPIPQSVWADVEKKNEYKVVSHYL